MYYKYGKLSISNLKNCKFNKGLIGMGICGNTNNSYKLVPVIITGLNLSEMNSVGQCNRPLVSRHTLGTLNHKLHSHRQMKKNAMNS